MTALVIAEHTNSQLKADTHKAVQAALLTGNEVDLLVAGAEGWTLMPVDHLVA